jgi:hypothetical protein
VLDGAIGMKVLDWPAIRGCLEAHKFSSGQNAFTGSQAKVARAVLERNGLL